jgi:hypothetical protein
MGAKSHADGFYYLNCAAVSAIGAHGSVTFQMRLPLPLSQAPGVYYKLDWQIQGGSGPATVASQEVQVR